MATPLLRMSVVDLGKVPLIWLKKKKFIEGRKAGRASKTKPPLPLSSRSGSASAHYVYVEDFWIFPKFKRYVTLKSRPVRGSRGVSSELYKFEWNTFSKTIRTKNQGDLDVGEVVYLSLVCHIADSWVRLLNGYDFYFWFRDSVNQPLNLFLPHARYTLQSL